MLFWTPTPAGHCLPVNKELPQTGCLWTFLNIFKSRGISWRGRQWKCLNHLVKIKAFKSFVYETRLNSLLFYSVIFFLKSFKMLSFKLMSSVAIVVLITAELSSALLQSNTATYVKGKRVATSYATLQPYSKMKCVGKCAEENLAGRCTVAGYNTATQTCFLSDDSPADVTSITDETSGVFIFQQGTCIC